MKVLFLRSGTTAGNHRGGNSESRIPRLLGMKERVLAFGGELQIFGDPDEGTALILKIPQHKIPSLQHDLLS